MKDHLGNARVTYSDGNNDGVIAVADIKQINHYYPFGMNMEGNWNGAAGSNKYQYNGKEWNDDFGLGLNDYGFRMYDPAIGRFPMVDPLAEVYKNQNPYTYAANNPISFIDFMGLGPESLNQDDKKKDKDNGELPTVTVTAKRSHAAPAWIGFIGSWTNDDFQAFRKSTATDFIRQRNTQYEFQPGMEGVDISKTIEDTESVATEDEAMDLLKELWAQDNSIGGMNYLSIKAETISTTQEAVPVMAKAGATLLISWAGVKIPKNIFGLNRGYGIQLKIGTYKIDALYANPRAGAKAGTVISIKQAKNGGNLFRLDYGKLHSTGEMGLHTTFRFTNPLNGSKVGSTAQRTWYPPFKMIK